MDLTSLSLAELKKLHKDVASAIANFEDRAKSKARAELEAQARALGFSLAELVGVDASRTRAPASAKYAQDKDCCCAGVNNARSSAYRRRNRNLRYSAYCAAQTRALVGAARYSTLTPSDAQLKTS